ncbi:SPW repeat protein [Nocardia australiensis]|uniref:SPW repeat protein n=1 Tax=Nocardia australiensis TaxID=2887191 RepID=UPI001D151136|nr:SPW repeat protein [Nocardia australiensis]
MFTGSRTQDYLAVVLGVFAALSPLWVETNNNGMWSLIVLGALVALAGLAQIYRPAMEATDYAMGLFGALLFISPWAMNYTAYRGASWTAWVIGIVTVVVAVAALPTVSGRLHDMAPHH